MNTEPISAAEAERILVTCDGAGKEAKREALARLIASPLCPYFDKPVTWMEAHTRKMNEAFELSNELASLKLALRPLRDRIEDELKSGGRPALLAIQWFRIEPIVKALGIAMPTNQNPLP